MNGLAEEWTEGQTERPMDKWTDRQIGGLTWIDRQAYRETEFL